MGKFIYEDKEAWKAAVKKNLESVNTTLPEDKKMSAEEIDKKAEERINDEALVDAYKHSLKIQDKVNQHMAAYERWIAEKQKADPSFDVKGLNGFGPFVYCKMDVSGTPEAEKKNFEYLDKLTDRKFAEKEVMRDFKRMLSQDPTKFKFNTPEEGLKLFEENFEIATICFSVDRMLNSVGKYNLSPQFNQFYKEHKRAIESISACMSCFEQYRQATRLLIPSVGEKELDAASGSFVMNNMELEGKYEGLEIGKSADATVAAYAQMTAEFSTRPQERYFMEQIGKTLPTTIMSNYKCLIDDKEEKLFDGIDSKCLNDGRKVEFVEYTDQEKMNITHAIDNPFMDDQKMKDSYGKMQDLAKQLKDTDHWYNWNNTTEFKNLVTALNNLSKDPRDYRSMLNLAPEFKKIETAAQAYFDKKNGKDMNTNGVKRFEICKSILDYAKKCISGEAFEVRVVTEEPVTRRQLDFTNEVNGPEEKLEEFKDASKDLNKTIEFEKDSEAEKEFLEEISGL